MHLTRNLEKEKLIYAALVKITKGKFDKKLKSTYPLAADSR